MSKLQNASFVKTARRIYVDGPIVMRTLQSLRPWICPYEKLIRAVPARSKVLDVGCGGGLFLGLLAVHGDLSAGTGFDVSESAIRVAKEMSGRPEIKGKLSFLRLDAGEEWPNNSYDVVSLVDVMHHIQPSDQKTVFMQAAEHVKPGGKLLYKDMALRPRWMSFMNRMHDLVLAQQWIHYVAMSDVISWGECCNLEPEYDLRTSLFWYCHEMVVFRKRSIEPMGD